jgi:hypothetical protein
LFCLIVGREFLQINTILPRSTIKNAIFMKKYLLLLYISALSFACAKIDIQENTGNQQNTHEDSERNYYLSEPHGTVLIELAHEAELTTAFSVSVKKNPQAGILELTETGLYRYTPYASALVPANDHILFEINQKGHLSTFKANILFSHKSSLPCEGGAQTDTFSLRTDTVSLLSVRKNDIFCSPVRNENVKIFEQAKGGELAFSGDEIIYRPKNNFFGADKFIYSVREENGKMHFAEVFLQLKPALNPCRWELLPDNFSFKVSADSLGSEPALLNLPVFDNDQLCIEKTDWKSLKITMNPQKGSLKIDNMPDGQKKIGYIATFPLPLDDSFEYELCPKSGACQRVRVNLKVSQ